MNFPIENNLLNLKAKNVNKIWYIIEDFFIKNKDVWKFFPKLNAEKI